MSDQHRNDRPQADPAGIDEPHDVLAAEEFAMPTRDERFPADPTGVHEPHDVLAAEEFAMPANGGAGGMGAGRGARAWILPALGAAALGLLLRRRR